MFIRQTLLPSKALKRIKAHTGHIDKMTADVAKQGGIALTLYNRLLAIRQEVLDVFGERAFNDPGSKRIFWRQVLEVEVLSEGESPPQFEDLDDVYNAITTGDCSGQWNELASHPIDGREAASLLQAQASDPGFFNLTEDGADINEEDDDGKE